MSSPLFAAMTPSLTKSSPSQLQSGSEHFKVTIVRGVLFEKLPPKLQSQVAYRHFYTDIVDRNSHHLSCKFFSLVILYFCAIFKLQGRRMQYKANQSEKAGRDFAKAHRRAKAVFRKLTACYGTILMRYNTNSILVLEKRGGKFRDDLVNRGPIHPGVGLKAPIPAVTRTPAFVYVSDEMVFFEHLFQFTVQIVRHAFNGDESLQALAEVETNKLFRSNSFLFHHRKREEHVKKAAVQLDRQADHRMLNNAKELAQLLTPPVQPLVMKYANMQRTPFMGTQFPGGTNHIRYQRPRRGVAGPEADVERSKNEAAYTIEVRHADFPPGHRALQVYEALQRRYASVRRSLSPRSQSSADGSAGRNRATSPPAAAATAAKNADAPIAAKMAELRQGLDDYDEPGAPVRRRSVAAPGGSSVRGQTSQSNGGGEIETGVDEFASISLSVRENPPTAPPKTTASSAALRRDASRRGSMSSIADPIISPSNAAPGQVASTQVNPPFSPVDLGDDTLNVTTSITVMAGDKSLVSEKGVPVSRMRGAARRIQLAKRFTEAQLEPELLAKAVTESSIMAHTYGTIDALPSADKPVDPFLRLLDMPDEKWADYELQRDIDSVYQSLANGVEISSFGIPEDILLDYGDDGILVVHLEELV